MARLATECEEPEEAYLVASLSLTIADWNRRLQRSVLPIINSGSDSPSLTRLKKPFCNGDASKLGNKAIYFRKLEDLASISASLNSSPVARTSPAALGY